MKLNLRLRLALLVFFPALLQAQYTELINTNRPGKSQGAFAPGVMVFQGELSPFYGQEDHNLLNYERTLIGSSFQIRAGVFLENLEINYIGTFVNANQTVNSTLGSTETTFSNFERSTLGAKYLVYDPWKKRDKEGPNLYSWHANNSFQWEYLIPAVSVYAAANMNFSTPNTFTPPNDPSVSPRFDVITQNNFGRWVVVLNFTVDRITTDFPTYGWISTVTHTLDEKWSVFGEYQGFKSDFYSDDLFRAGAAYLIHDDLQVDLAGTMNFKDTPSLWRINAGVAYRLDFHEDKEVKQKKTRLNEPDADKDEGDTPDGREK